MGRRCERVRGSETWGSSARHALAGPANAGVGLAWRRRAALFLVAAVMSSGLGGGAVAGTPSDPQKEDTEQIRIPSRFRTVRAPVSPVALAKLRRTAARWAGTEFESWFTITDPGAVGLVLEFERVPGAERYLITYDRGGEPAFGGSPRVHFDDDSLNFQFAEGPRDYLFCETFECALESPLVPPDDDTHWQTIFVPNASAKADAFGGSLL